MVVSTETASVPATRLSVGRVDLSLGSCQQRFFNLAKSPPLTNCHVREEEHGTGVTVNMKRDRNEERLPDDS